MSEILPSTREPEKIFSIDSEYLSGERFPYQEDISLVEDIDLEAATPGQDINWLEDIELLEEEGMPAVFDRYSNSFLKLYFDIPAGRENEIARKVLIAHLRSGNSYGIRLKEQHCKFPQPELGPWVEGSRTVGDRLEAVGARRLGAAAPLMARRTLRQAPRHRSGRPRSLHRLAPRRARRGGARRRQDRRCRGRVGDRVRRRSQQLLPAGDVAS